VKAISGKQFCRLPESRGWALKRIDGSHHIDAQVGHSARISIPVHGNTPLKLGLQRALMNLANIGESDL